MYKILKQLQSETKKISVLLVIDLWVSGYITYVDKEVMCFEAEKRKGVFYTQVIRLSSIIALDYISDITVSNKDKVSLDDEGNLKTEEIEDDDDDDNDNDNNKFGPSLI